VAELTAAQVIAGIRAQQAAEAADGDLQLLSIAINAYRGAPLRGCLTDSANMVAALQPRGFQVTTLHDADATLENMQDAIATLVGRLGPDSHGIVHYSGHGGYLAGAEPDQRDECWFAVDLRPLVDNKVAELASSVHRRAQLTFILDSCYSHTATRNAPLGVESAGDSYRQGKFLVPAQHLDGAAKVRAERVRKAPGAAALRRLGRSKPIFEFSACTDAEVTYDAQINGVIQGCYTRALLDCAARLWATSDRFTHGQLQHAIQGKLPSEEYPTHPQTYASEALHRWWFAAVGAAGDR
jgi:hypothetical protein